jgi:hypothetical protein
MVSGLFDTTTAEAGAPLRSYFGTDSALYAERSALPGLVASQVPMLLAYAELDPCDFQMQSEQAQAALRGAGRPSRLLKLLGHSHMSEVYAINTDDQALSGAVAEFVTSLRCSSRAWCPRDNTGRRRQGEFLGQRDFRRSPPVTIRLKFAAVVSPGRFSSIGSLQPPASGRGRTAVSTIRGGSP